MLTNLLQLSRNTLFALYSLAIISFVIFITSAGYLIVYIDKPNDLTQKKVVLVEKGSSLEDISYKLADEEIINSPEIFVNVLRVANHYESIKAGEYAFLPNISPKQVINILSSGESIIRKIVFIEGTTSHEIIERLKNDKLLDGEIVHEFADGQLLPDTYYYTYGDKRQALLNKMNKALEEFLDEHYLAKPESIKLTRHEVVTLASIIEKETSLKKERKRVSGVFHNRLNQKMKLQADPTVIYSITKGKADLNRNLNYSDLKHDSPYNTYKFEGLPPGPITNPGRAAIIAAMNPQQTKELYFVANGKGGHVFAENMKGHLQNVYAYRKKTKQKKKNNAN